MDPSTLRPRLAELLLMDNPQEVFREICYVASLISKNLNVSRLELAIKDLEDLFEGRYPDYQACNTDYHDLIHTTDATLAMVRLIHGNVLAGMKFDDHDILLAIISTLFHDSGYIQRKDDVEGTGAKYTKGHVERSVEFIRDYYLAYGYSEIDFEKSKDMIRCTGLEVNLDNISFVSPEVEALGKMLGIADLYGQMAARYYLEKLIFLYQEFKEGQVDCCENEFDLLKKTLAFYDMTNIRFEKKLGGYHHNMILHFKNRYGIDEDLYATAISNHLQYTKFIISNHPLDYRSQLRRGRLMELMKKKI